MRVTKIFLLPLFAVVFTLTTSTLTTSATAQPADTDEPSAGAKRRSPHARKRPTAAQIEKRVKKLRDKVLRGKVGLSDAEAKKVEAVFQRHSAARTKAQQRLREGRRALRRLFKSDSDDQAAYDAALTKVQSGHFEMQRIRKLQFDELRTLLEPKQQALLLRELQKMRRKIQKFKKKNRGEKRGGKRRRGQGR